jgi:hypothetical protein
MKVRKWLQTLVEESFRGAICSEGETSEKHFAGQKNFAHVVSTNYSQYKM